MTDPTVPVPPLPKLTVKTLADFKGKEEMFFGWWAPNALDMASFLISEITGINELDPTDERGNRLFSYAAMELAFQLYLEQEYAEISVNPFSGETIGSYSYNKSQAVKTVLSGDATDNIWLKLLMDYAQNVLLIGGTDISSGGIVGMEYDNALIDSQGRIVRVLGPKDDPEYFDGIFGNEGRHNIERPRF